MFDIDHYTPKEKAEILSYLKGFNPEEFKSRLQSSETFRIEVTLEILQQIEETLLKERKVAVYLEEKKRQEGEQRQLRNDFLKEVDILKDLLSSLGVSSPMDLVLQTFDRTQTGEKGHTNRGGVISA